MRQLSWLPVDPEWKTTLARVPPGKQRWDSLQQLANFNIDFVQTSLIDRRLLELPSELGPEPVRLALLSSCTVDQLVPGLRVAALRRGIRLNVHMPLYGQYRLTLLDSHSTLSDFRPHVVLFSIDASSFVGNDFIADPAAAERHLNNRINELIALWRIARERFGAHVIQQAFLQTFPHIIGNAEYRSYGSPAAMVNAANWKIREAAQIENVDILAVDEHVQRYGIAAWHSYPLWHRAKQEISPIASPIYGELAMRMVAARQGLSAKCLVLDLDNTLWGGEIGDDGLEGIVLGEGSAEGEAFLAFQRYVKSLARRGVIVAICSKNDEANALEAFEKHPEMILRRTDIACFVANWDDKATNLRRIAAELNIGIDSLVFADDNPFERNIVRRALPTVKVPELADEPALFSNTLAAAGYFEALEITQEDLARGTSYQVSRALRSGEIRTTDLIGYLAGLDMQLFWSRVDSVSLKRVTQLINKTNQFNLTTRRYTEPEVGALIDDPNAIVLHLRLVDRYADHGIISVVIAKHNSDDALEIDTWLMSCRVLGRGVERATLSVLLGEAYRKGYRTIVGTYRPTEKNGMVRDHYARLGFDSATVTDGLDTWILDVTKTSFATPNNFRIIEATNG